MSYSPKLQYFCERLEGLSVGLFRLEPQNQSSNISPQSIIRFTLPSNALVDIHSFAFHFNAQTNEGAAAGTVSVRLPNKIESLINRVEVSVGGVAVSAGSNFYNVLAHAKAVVDGYEENAGMGHPEIITTGAGNNYVDGTTLTRGEKPTANNNVAQFCVNNWCGFLGECEPRVLDSSLMGDIVVTIYLEQASLSTTVSDNVNAAGFITSAALGGTLPTYALNNVYATIRCYSLANGVYDNMIAEQMSSAGSLEIGFKQYFSFRDTNTGSTRYTVASQSLDRVIVAHHNNANPATTTLHPVLATGYNQIGAGNAAGDAARTLDFGKVKYLAPYFDFSEPASASAALFEHQLNGAKFPQYRATVEDMLQITRLSSHYEDKYDKTMGLQQYRKNNFVTAIKLTLDAPNARYIQGLDTRSVALNGYYYIYNMTGSKVITLFAECTSSLIVSAGRQIAVVQ